MKAVVDLLLPERCAACAAPAFGLCAQCEQEAAPLRLRNAAFASLGPRVGALGAYAYSGVMRDAVRGMKISGRFSAARHLSVHVRGLCPAAMQEWPVTWVPSTPRRLRERGVELPRLLAGPGAVALLERRRDRPDQTSLTPGERRLLPPDTFVASVAVTSGVVLVDDVRTTGATATAAATALLAAGAHRVLVATLAVGGDDARQTALAPLAT